MRMTTVLKNPGAKENLESAVKRDFILMRERIDYGDNFHRKCPPEKGFKDYCARPVCP